MEDCDVDLKQLGMMWNVCTYQFICMYVCVCVCVCLCVRVSVSARMRACMYVCVGEV
jgi:hypothetical protein